MFVLTRANISAYFGLRQKHETHRPSVTASLQTASTNSSRKIKSIHIYPVKSCKGIQVDSAAIKPFGFLWDRAWMIVKEDNGRMITQRQNARLALIQTALPPEAFIGTLDESAPNAVLTLTAPGMPGPVTVPLASNVPADSLSDVSVWDWQGKAADQGEEVAAWLSQYLETPCRLVKYVGKEVSEAAFRPTTGFAEGFEVQFADAYPVLVASQEDMDDLNARMGLAEPLPIDRFRPNIVLEGCTPWEKDGWSKIGVTTTSGSTVTASLVKPCDRCKIPTIDQNTGTVSGAEPLKTLTQFRSGKALGWAALHKSWTHAVFFGWNLVFHEEGILSVGDTVEVTEMRGKDFPVVVNQTS